MLAQEIGLFAREKCDSDAFPASIVKFGGMTSVNCSSGAEDARPIAPPERRCTMESAGLAFEQIPLVVAITVNLSEIYGKQTSVRNKTNIRSFIIRTISDILSRQASSKKRCRRRHTCIWLF